MLELSEAEELSTVVCGSDMSLNSCASTKHRSTHPNGRIVIVEVVRLCKLATLRRPLAGEILPLQREQ